MQSAKIGNRQPRIPVKRMVEQMIERATAARRFAYAPYSRFRVGACVLAADGKMFTGCNVENATFGLTVCAERNALANAIGAGAREILAVAVVTGTRMPTAPCGSCRQVIAEFNPKAWILMMTPGGEPRSLRLDKLLPDAFRLPQNR